MISHTFVVLAYKESEFLEECLKSVTNQSVKTNVLIATTTPNDYINNLANKYSIDVVCGKHTSIGGDFDFARNSADTDLVTIAHQDDVYDYTYAEEVINSYKKDPDSIIIFSDYFEIRNGEKTYTNLNLKIKRLLLTSLRFKKLSGFKHFKRNVLRYGNAISCPAVSYVQKNCPEKIFDLVMKCDIDWAAWEMLSRKKGKFIFIPKKLMGHRIDDSTTTSDIINQGIRTKEDLLILERFWPKRVAKMINRLYKGSEKNNNL